MKISRVHLDVHTILILAFYLLSVSGGVAALTLRRDALAFHTRDYNYYVEFAARLADPQLIDRYSINIEGYNMAGLQGIEGVVSLHQTIHSEPYRFVNAGLFWLFRAVWPLYLVFCLLYFLPLLYLLWVARRSGTEVRDFLSLFVLLYVFFPGTLLTITTDLRSRLLFLSAWSLMILSIYFERPFGEKLIFLLFLPFIREEGIVLGAIAAVLNFIHMEKKKERWWQTLVYALFLVAAWLFFTWLMGKCGFIRVDQSFNPVHRLRDTLAVPFNQVILLVGFALVIAGWFWYRRHAQTRPPFIFWVVYCGVFAVGGVQFSRVFGRWFTNVATPAGAKGWDVYLQIITWDQFSLIYGALVLLLFMLGLSFQGKARRAVRLGMVILCALMIVTTAVTLPARISDWRSQAQPARLIWDFKKTQDPYSTRLLVDFATYQAFYDFDTVVVYNRLPVWRVAPDLEARHYPANKELVAQAIGEGLEYAVIARESLENVRELAALAGRELVELQSNGTYLVLEIRPN